LYHTLSSLSTSVLSKFPDSGIFYMYLHYMKIMLKYNNSN